MTRAEKIEERAKELVAQLEGRAGMDTDLRWAFEDLRLALAPRSERREGEP